MDTSFSSDNVNNEILNTINDDYDSFISLFKGFYTEIIETFGKKVFDDINRKRKSLLPSNIKSYDARTEEILSYIDNTTAEKVSLITETTRNAIKAIVSESLAEGASILVMMEKIDNLYLEHIIPNRSRTIARTEVVGASNYGSLSGAKQVSAKLKKIWIPTLDDDVRDSHRNMLSHPAINLDESFSVAGFRARYPSDQSLPPSQSINCRCTIGYEYADGEA
jgi:hypothetical protein